MTVLDRSHLAASPDWEEQFLAGATPGKFAEYPRPDGARLRTKYEFGGTSNSARGLGLNQNGAVETAESEFYSEYNLKLGSPQVTMRSPFTQNADDTFTITAKPLLAAEKTAIMQQPNGSLLNTPTHLSGMLATEFRYMGLWECRMKRTEARGDFDAFWVAAPPGCPQNEYDFEFVACDTGKVFMTSHVGMDNYYAKRSTVLVDQSSVAIDSTIFHTYQLLLTHEQVLWAIDETVVKVKNLAPPNDGCLLPVQAIVNKAKNGGWNTTHSPPSIADGTETSTLTIDFMRHTPAK